MVTIIWLMIRGNCFGAVIGAPSFGFGGNGGFVDGDGSGLTLLIVAVTF